MVNPTIDESSISPTLERRNSLEKSLQARPDVQDLKHRHILLDTSVAPYATPLSYNPRLDFHLSIVLKMKINSSLQAAQQELARQRASDNLKKNLGRRPERDELIERMTLSKKLLIKFISFSFV